MASIANLTLLSENIASNTTSERKSLPKGADSFIIVLNVSNHAAGAYSLQMEESSDGVNWSSLGAVVGPQATDGVSLLKLAAGTSVLPNIRAVVTVVAGNADVKAQLWYDPR